MLGRLQPGVHVARAIGVTPQTVQHIAHRAVVGHRVKRRSDRPETVVTISVGMEACAQGHGGVRAFLQVVEAFRVARPDIELAVGNGLADRIGHAAMVVGRLARLTHAEVRPQGQLGRAFPEKGAEHRGLGGALAATLCLEGRSRLGLLNGHHQHGDAQGIGQQDELLAFFVTHLARLSQELDTGHPFFGRDLHLLHKGMGVLDEGGHHFFEPGLFAVGHAGDDGLGEVLGFELHVLSPIEVSV